MIQAVILKNYTARPATGGVLHLGSWGSYGNEQLQILPGDGWHGLTITATFHPCGGDPVRVLVPESGLFDVPPEATAKPSAEPARVVFAGAADGVQRISCDLPYIVAGHAPIEGSESTATPGMDAQVLAEVAAAREEMERLRSEGVQAEVSAEAVASAVDAYMAAHPVPESDPTVPAWAKAEQKPAYTAAEVGAMPADTPLPTVPTKVSAFTNDAGYAKAADVIPAPATAEVGQTIVVTAVDDDGKPTEWECADMASGGGGEWELIADATTTEEVVGVTVSEDINGAPLSFTSGTLLVKVRCAPTATNDANKDVKIIANEAKAGFVQVSYMKGMQYAATHYTQTELFCLPEMGMLVRPSDQQAFRLGTSATPEASIATYMKTPQWGLSFAGPKEIVNFRVVAVSGVLGIGSMVQIWRKN